MLKYDIKSVANHLKEEGPNPLFSKLINININYNIISVSNGLPEVPVREICCCSH